MKTVSIIARYLLGLLFTVFGLNGFLNFIHQPPRRTRLRFSSLSPSVRHILPRSSSRCS
jgi:hypothetical protein